MYKIGEMSKISGITVKALRYYDQQNILVPSARNEENAYRLYAESDLTRAHFIAKLRAFEFSIAEIKDVLRLLDNSEDLNGLLLEKRAMLAAEVAQQQKIIAAIDASIEREEGQQQMEPLEIIQVDKPSVSVAYIRYQGAYDDIGRQFKQLYRMTRSHIAGKGFCRYYDEGYSDVADIEVCVPVNKRIEGGDIRYQTLPATSFIGTVHIGNYDAISSSYKAVIDYAIAHHINLGVPSRQVYVKGPGMIFKGNPNKYQTEILLPIV